MDGSLEGMTTLGVTKMFQMCYVGLGELGRVVQFPEYFHIQYLPILLAFYFTDLRLFKM